MSRDFVAEHPVNFAPGVSEMLSDPNHFRYSGMAVVDYAKASPSPAPLGWEPLLDSKPEPEPEPPSRWARLRAALR